MPLDRLHVDVLPDGCDAVLATSDLQGVASSPWGGAPDLLAIALADHLAVWADDGLIPPPGRIGVLLAGDLYSSPRADRRGVSGDVLDAWLAFAVAGCPWVVGVSGNHDRITRDELRDAAPAADLLDGTCVERGGVRIAGVGGVIGKPGQAQRRTERDFLGAVSTALACDPDVLLLHEGPSGDEPGQLGNDGIRAHLDGRPPPLTLCGHVGWDRPVARLGAGRVVNLDGRAVLLTRP
jgi:3',5'-cyclic-AMP phosphodiesterase